MTYIQDLTESQQAEYHFIAQLLTLGKRDEFTEELKKFKIKHGIN
jgi:hypothetical protein